MTNFDTLPRQMAGEDALARIREFAESDIGQWTPLRARAADYLRNGAGFGELENRLSLAVLCDALVQQDRRIKALEGREEDRP